MIKVGDWVSNDGVVMRVSSMCDYDKYACWVDDNGVQEFTNIAKKLPIKFKGFEVKQECYGSWGFADGVSERRKIIQGNSHAKFFTEIVDETMKLFIGHVGKPYAIKSDPMPISQARDWLELQYATLIAKARGLV
jgi:hypothetical protein